MLPKWPYRPGGRPPLGPANGCHARMWARHCQVLLLSRRVRDPEFSVKPFQFYTSAVNLKNVNVCTSPTNYVRGPRSAQRPRRVTLPQRPALGPSAPVCAAVPWGGSEACGRSLNEPLCLAGLVQTGYATVGGCPEAPCGPETMYKRNGLMASVSVTSATPQVRRFRGRGRGGRGLLAADPGPSWAADAKAAGPVNTPILRALEAPGRARSEIWEAVSLQDQSVF